MRRQFLNVLIVTLTAACGDGDPMGAADASTDAQELTGRYLPMAEGTTWSYRVTDLATGVVTTKVTTVGALEDVGGMKAGTTAFKVTTSKTNAGGTKDTVSWQEDTGTAVIRHREQTFDVADALKTDEFYVQSKLRLDEDPTRLMMSATFTDTYEEISFDVATMMTTTTPRTDTWTVEAFEDITVPAGTFHCMRIRRTGSAVGQSDKTYWFARGIGKVKEYGGQVEELESTSLLP